MKAWNAVTNIMTDITNTSTTKNVFFHCRVGADRTGTVAYLLEGLLGVPDEMRYEEYALTNLSGLYDRTRYYKEKTSSNNLKFVYMMGYVKTTQDIYDWYMQNPNASASLIQAFRTAMTVPANQQQQSPQNLQMQQKSQTSLNSISGVSTGNNDDTETSGSANSNSMNGVDSAYEVPLGALESTDTDVPMDAGLMVAAATAATAGAVSYALFKRNYNEE